MRCQQNTDGLCRTYKLKPCIFNGDSDKCDEFFISCGRTIEKWKKGFDRLVGSQANNITRGSTENNDGNDVCRWCGKETSILVLFSSISRVCSDCGR